MSAVKEKVDSGRLQRVRTILRDNAGECVKSRHVTVLGMHSNGATRREIGAATGYTPATVTQIVHRPASLDFMAQEGLLFTKEALARRKRVLKICEKALGVVDGTLDGKLAVEVTNAETGETEVRETLISSELRVRTALDMLNRNIETAPVSRTRDETPDKARAAGVLLEARKRAQRAMRMSDADFVMADEAGQDLAEVEAEEVLLEEDDGTELPPEDEQGEVLPEEQP